MPLASLTVLMALTRSALLPTTSLMPGMSTIAPLTMLALRVIIGRVLPALPTALVTFGSIVLVFSQAIMTSVSMASPYAASLLPK